MTSAPSPARRAFRQLVIAVVTVHAVAISLYYALDMKAAPGNTQRYFAWAWMAVTVAVVLGGLQRLKRARRAR